ncbi:MAG TPA: 1-(5-phosphoribosyl)-5-[(5-phosphoribosylamino)methylideneamino] imidazole-4-carboxamide isomerase, partial [Bacteroidia bacterium]|nr:1-(5-phosphoribosyl)-5-[(5-phosphoribosylamino)methylideneamino] imidazole-4-carboxamide isomerase [Bacteroidia bacterium]
EEAGLKRLHIVDLDGAKAGKVKNISVLEEIASATSLQIDFGGGIKTTGELKAVLDAGAVYASVGSVAVKAPELFTEWVHAFGPEKFFLGADVRDGKIAVQGWLEQTEIDAVDFIHEQMRKRIAHVFCTDISRDGLMTGPSLTFYRHLLFQCPGLRLVASGGVSSLEDIRALDRLGCDGVIVGKAIYEGKIPLAELSAINEQ